MKDEYGTATITTAEYKSLLESQKILKLLKTRGKVIRWYSDYGIRNYEQSFMAINESEAMAVIREEAEKLSKDLREIRVENKVLKREVARLRYMPFWCKRKQK